MMSKRVLMLVGEFSEEYEIFVFQQALEAVGHQVDIVCPATAQGIASRPACTISAWRGS
jgi:protease I